mmetsp:Transcript_38005/g.67001  ORF Transcript_38005/g.67001 Transcript_38005/m.67001 type:complete len:97 (+) Transcript_38005:240-530(+)
MWANRHIADDFNIAATAVWSRAAPLDFIMMTVLFTNALATCHVRKEALQHNRQCMSKPDHGLEKEHLMQLTTDNCDRRSALSGQTINNRGGCKARK